MPGADRAYYSATFVAQWLEAIGRDYSHPCIVAWCGLNETGYKLEDRICAIDDVTRAMFLAAKAMDRTRPVLDTSGFAHRVPETDIYDSHDYVENPNFFKEGLEEFRERHAHLLTEGKPYINPYLNLPSGFPQSVGYDGQPYFVSEMGGIKWPPEEGEASGNWGFGSTPSSIEEWYSRFEALIRIILESGSFGYCWVQDADVGLEKNGLWTSDREPKFDLARLNEIQERLAHEALARLRQIQQPE